MEPKCGRELDLDLKRRAGGNVLRHSRVEFMTFEDDLDDLAGSGARRTDEFDDALVRSHSTDDDDTRRVSVVNARGAAARC